MPAKLDRCVRSVRKQGKNRSSAFAICNASQKRSAKRTGRGKVRRKK